MGLSLFPLFCEYMFRVVYFEQERGEGILDNETLRGGSPSKTGWNTPRAVLLHGGFQVHGTWPW